MQEQELSGGLPVLIICNSWRSPTVRRIYVLQHLRQIQFQTNLSISQISEQVGFADYRYFTKLFSKIMGMSPTLYRKRFL